jgi:hypothetical protein
MLPFATCTHPQLESGEATPSCHSSVLSVPQGEQANIQEARPTVSVVAPRKMRCPSTCPDTSEKAGEYLRRAPGPSLALAVARICAAACAGAAHGHASLGGADGPWKKPYATRPLTYAAPRLLIPHICARGRCAPSQKSPRLWLCPQRPACTPTPHATHCCESAQQYRPRRRLLRAAPHPTQTFCRPTPKLSYPPSQPRGRVIDKVGT